MACAPFANTLLLPVILLATGCVSLPRDNAVPAPAAPALASTAVRCNCVVNERRDDKQCQDPAICPGPMCPCPGMDFDLCLPPDLNHDTATDPKVQAMLADPNYDFNAAVFTFCRERAAEIMTDIGAVSQHEIICDGKSNSYFNVDVPALINCQPVAYEGMAGTASTWHSDTCSKPCGDVVCVNGPRSDIPNANCDGDDVFTRTALHPDACRCNRVLAQQSCVGRDSELFCIPPPGEPRSAPKLDGP